jgi:hypothetical protein
MRGHSCGALAAVAALGLAPAANAGEPWVDEDPWQPRTRHEFGEYGLMLGAEYRANWLYVNPIDLNGTRDRRASFIEHRLRLDSSVDYDERVKLVLSIDALDGTLWGDNGTFGGSPSPNSGIRVSASNPNNARAVVGFRGGDELDPDSYGYVLAPNDPVSFRRVYGEVSTPIGLLRIGRQQATDGMNLLVADGDGRKNRFGYANRGDSVDRILFATKPLEGFKPSEERDVSQDRGLFYAIFYDRVADGEIRTFGDDLNGIGNVLRWLDPQPELHRDFEAQLIHVYRWEREFDTDIHGFGARGTARIDRLSAGFEVIHILGATREVSTALARINPGDPIRRQDVRQWGARGVARWDEPIWTAYLEVDFATGDRNPNPADDLTQMAWAEDNNVGLLMFERILAFESARSAGSGVALLRRLEAPTFPADRIDTEGSFTSALAVFPQFDLHPEPELLLRAGVLVAWSPAGLVDPITTLQNRDGVEVEDDLVNFNGGKPGNFYGVELDGRFQWRYRDHFIFDLEGAILFPGDAFHDENEQAARSVLVQGRTTFAF